MINEKSFAMEHIESIRNNKRVDINLLERSIVSASRKSPLRDRLK